MGWTQFELVESSQLTATTERRNEMAEIYDLETGNEISSGLQGSAVCDEAMRAAKGIAADRNEPVELVDGDEDWCVYPDGRVEAVK